MSDLQYFDPGQDYAVTWRKLPHWAQAGTVCFITWRTADSLPTEVHLRLEQERRRVLLDQGIDPDGDWKTALSQLPNTARGRIQWALFEMWDRSLDQGWGDCFLRDATLSQLVADSLLHFDGERYLVTDHVVMPNHVHLLCAFRDEQTLLTQCTSWKRYTGRRINAHLGRIGEFWQVDQFDHLVRSPEQFEHYRRYIAENPKRARLTAGEYRHYSKEL